MGFRPDAPDGCFILGVLETPRQESLSVDLGRTEGCLMTYVREGAKTRFAAPDIASGNVVAR